MTISQYFPIYDQLDKADQERLDYAAVKRRVPKGTLLHGGDGVCTGLLVIASGQLRAHMISEEGREITLYRLFERDICLFSASCIMSSLQFDVFISAEKDTELWIIPPDFYKGLMERSAVVANYTSQIMASRFTDVMWLMDQVMWKSYDKRLAGFLLEESVLEETDTLKITHEKIASHMGTAREVVTRMLKYFQTEGLVRLSRGAVEILDRKGLSRLFSNES